MVMCVCMCVSTFMCACHEVCVYVCISCVHAMKCVCVSAFHVCKCHEACVEVWTTLEELVSFSHFVGGNLSDSAELYCRQLAHSFLGVLRSVSHLP